MLAQLSIWVFQQSHHTLRLMDEQMTYTAKEAPDPSEQTVKDLGVMYDQG
jgi:hypothetical protein